MVFGNMFSKMRSSESSSRLAVGHGGVFLENEMPAHVESLQKDAHVPAVADGTLVVQPGTRNPGSRHRADALSVDEGNGGLHDLGEEFQTKSFRQHHRLTRAFS